MPRCFDPSIPDPLISCPFAYPHVMTPSGPSGHIRITVLVPLEDELRRLRRALRSATLADAKTATAAHQPPPAITLIRTGPGAAAIERCIAHLPRTEDESGSTVIILAGCAGGLSPRADEAHSALLIDEVRTLDEHSDCLSVGTTSTNAPGTSSTRCPLATALAIADERWSVLGVDQVLNTPASKARAFARTNADIVDTESHAFARAMTSRGGRWLIIRGLSDRHDESLPRGVEGFVDPQGRTRISAVLWALMKRPTLFGTLLRLGSRTEEAMRRVARTISSACAILEQPPTISPFPAPVLQALRTSVSGAPAADKPPVLTIMGGSFDPFTRAHAQIAIAGVHQANAPGQSAQSTPVAPALLLIPAGRSPHKSSGPIAHSDDRRAMIERTLRGTPAFESIAWGVWEDEIRRLLLRPDEPSYSVHTAQRLRALLESAGLAHVRLRWIIGADQALAMHRWHKFERFMQIADPIVLLRPDPTDAEAPTWEAAADRLIERLRATNAWDEAALDQWRVRVAKGPLIAGSSTRVRELLGELGGLTGNGAGDQQDRRAELRTLLHDDVVAFIQQRGLYGCWWKS